MLKSRFSILFLLGWIIFQPSCTHDSLLEDFDPATNDPVISDSTNVADTSMMGDPCDPELVYFENQILPILQGSCAISGCHDATTGTEDVILNSYDNVMNTGDIEPFDPEESKIYRIITEDDTEDIMPPGNRLSIEKITLLENWILQGAKNLQCDENPDGCDTVDVSYASFVAPLIDTRCLGCHVASIASGNVILEGFANVKENAENGKLFGAIDHQDGYSPMPQNQEKLSNCNISKIKSWINEGAQNN